MKIINSFILVVRHLFLVVVVGGNDKINKILKHTPAHIAHIRTTKNEQTSLQNFYLVLVRILLS